MCTSEVAVLVRWMCESQGQRETYGGGALTLGGEAGLIESWAGPGQTDQDRQDSMCRVGAQQGLVGEECVLPLWSTQMFCVECSLPALDTRNHLDLLYLLGYSSPQKGAAQPAVLLTSTRTAQGCVFPLQAGWVDGLGSIMPLLP